MPGGNMAAEKERFNPSRRALLAATAAATAGSVLQPHLALAQIGKNIYTIPGSEELVAASMPKQFSMAEIQRRWTKCREWMQRYDFDALVVPTVPEGNADIKWLTEGIPDWVVFPQQGRPTAIFRTGDEDSHFESLMGQHLDISTSLLNRSDLIIEALNKAGVANGRIGVGNLAGTLRYDEGGASYTTVSKLQKALPKAEFASASDLLMRVKLARGPEEIEALRLSTRIGELGVKAAVESAAPGVLQRDVWFQIAKAYLDASGESPGRITIRAGAEGNTADGKPLNEVIQSGQILSMTLSASVLGYNNQVNQTICIGQPEPANWKSTCQYNIELFEKLVEAAKPGRSFVDYVNFYKQEVDKRTAQFGGKPYTGVVFHTGGALGDGPRMGWQRDDENLDLVIEPGMVFTIKPRVPIPGLATPSTQIGDGVLITEKGAERLGRRKLEVITTS
jgi:Xaa-Pro aminopeptidase